MKKSKNFFKLEEKKDGKVFWNDVIIKPVGETRSRINIQQLDITPDVQASLTDTKVTTKFSDNLEKETVFE